MATSSEERAVSSTAVASSLQAESLLASELRGSASSSLAARRTFRLQDVASNATGYVTGGVSQRSIRRLLPSECLEDIYVFEDSLAKHGSKAVVQAKCRETGCEVIIKMRSKRFAAGGEFVWRSVLERMLNLDDHAHVLGLKGVCEDDKKYYVVMERCSGGELFDFLQTETDVPERECKRIMREILEAVDHLHYQGLIHRDIKPENIMFHDASKDPVTPGGNKRAIKLIDFDTCQEYEPQTPKAKHVVGTMGYIAPEALKGDYSPASDLWSIGVILYILMTGDMPFDVDSIIDTGALSETLVGSETMEELYERLKFFEIDFECEPWPSFPQACDLCKKLLAFNPGDRSPSAKEALKHRWLNE